MKVRLLWVMGAVLAGLTVVAGLMAQDILHASGPLPSYEVATVKRADKDSRNSLTVLRYIQAAYNIPAKMDVRVIGGPEWLRSDQYVIQGKPSVAERDAMQKMTNDQRSNETRLLQQSLLAERFHLKAHFETREMAVYELVQARGGSKMKQVAAPEAADYSKGGAPIPPPDKLSVKTMPAGAMMMSLRNGSVQMFANAVPVRSLVNALMQSGELQGRPVVDKTGLTGSYEMSLLFATTIGMNGAPPPAAGDVAAPSLFTALQESLGLQLVAKREPVEVIVIDSMERPTEN